jgi:serine/threonine-protein kinase HipA
MISGEDVLPDPYSGWIVKFHAREDALDDGRIEYAYSEMARAAGIHMPPTRLFMTRQDDAFFGVKRFDRDGNLRRHVHTFGNLIHANFRIPGCDYEMLLRVTRILTRNAVDVISAFRLMVFNIMAHNRDDHVKNFAFMMSPEGEWRLAPAYDLTFTHGPGGEHTMTVAGEGRAPTIEHILRIASNAEIEERQACHIINQVRDAVAAWPRYAAASGIGEKRISAIATSLQPLL